MKERRILLDMGYFVVASLVRRSSHLGLPVARTFSIAEMPRTIARERKRRHGVLAGILTEAGLLKEIERRCKVRFDAGEVTTVIAHVDLEHARLRLRAGTAFA